MVTLLWSITDMAVNFFFLGVNFFLGLVQFILQINERITQSVKITVEFVEYVTCSCSHIAWKDQYSGRGTHWNMLGPL